MNRSILGVVLALAASQAVADLETEATERCRALAGKHGSAAVRSCIDQDMAAANALAKYPKSAEATIMRCKTQLKYVGWVRVKVCVDRNMNAESTIYEYPEKYRSIVQGCQIRMGAFGAHMVKACAEREIENARRSAKD